MGRAGCLRSVRVSPPSPHCSGDEEGEEGGSSTHHVLGPPALEMFPSLLVMEGPKLAVCGSKVLFGVTV